MFWFVDGGILNGTPNHVSKDNYLWFQSQVDSTFIVCGLSIVIVGLANFGSSIAKYCILLYKKRVNLKNHEQKIHDLKSKKEENKKLKKADLNIMKLKSRYEQNIFI